MRDTPGAGAPGTIGTTWHEAIRLLEVEIGDELGKVPDQWSLRVTRGLLRTHVALVDGAQGVTHRGDGKTLAEAVFELLENLRAF